MIKGIPRRELHHHSNWKIAAIVVNFNILESQITSFKQVENISPQCVFCNPRQSPIDQTCGWGLEKWIGRRDLRCFCFSGERSNEQRQALTWLCSLEKAVPPVCVCDGIHLPHLGLFCRPKHSVKQWHALLGGPINDSLEYPRHASDRKRKIIAPQIKSRRKPFALSTRFFIGIRR